MSEEQHGIGLQDNAILQEEEASDDIIDMMTCVSEEENGNTDNESSNCDDSTSDENDIGNLHACHYACMYTCVYNYVHSVHCTMITFVKLCTYISMYSYTGPVERKW